MSGGIGRRAVCLGLPALALAGCGRRTSGPGTVTGALAPSTLRPPRFGDSDAVDWPGRHPGQYPVHGIDVSRFQGEVNWASAHATGTNFAYLKATEGGDRTDSAFAGNWQRSAQAGVARGAYHFYYFCTPAEVQARWFIANVPRQAGSLPPVLDLEWNPHSPSCRLRPPAETVRSEARIFLDILARHYGQHPLVYTTPDFWETNDIGRLETEFWLRSVADHPARRYDGRPWTFWQYSSTGRVDGISGQTDLNLFAGTAQRWRHWLNTRTVR